MWMSLLLLGVVVLNQVVPGLAIPAVDINSFTSVNCGTEGPTDEFGPISIELSVSDTVNVDNYTVYAFSADVSNDCTFVGDLATGSIIDAGQTYIARYAFTWPPVGTQETLTIGQVGTCGVERLDSSTLQMNIMVVEGALYTAQDKIFHIQCQYLPDTKYNVQVLAQNDPLPATEGILATAAPNFLDRIYSLALIEASSGRTIVDDVTIGTHVQLRALMTGDDGALNGPNDDENAIKVRRCTVTNSNGGNPSSLVENYCRNIGTDILWTTSVDYKDVKGFYTSGVGTDSTSETFEMFAVTGGLKNIVIFSCDIDVCRTAGDCLGDNCPNKRRKRGFLEMLGLWHGFRSTRAVSSGNVRISMTITKKKKVPTATLR